MGKGQKKDKSSYAEKRAAFWRALASEKQKDIRAGLVNTAMEAQTCNEDGLTGIQYAALSGKEKSLDVLLDWYERRREMRRKGWLNLTDDNGRTALMMAAAAGKVECMHILLLKEAKIEMKDRDGKTARDHAVARKQTKAVEFIDEWLRESDSDDGVVEDEEGNLVGDGLTSTQRSKIKKRAAMAKEQRGAVSKKDTKATAEEEEEPEDTTPGPVPKWPEVAKVKESVEMLRAICEATIMRDAPEEEFASSGGVDPALWYLRGINRLEMRLAPGVLTSIQGPELARLRRLQTIILSGNALASLPDEIGRLKQLKALNVSHNKLTELPSTLSKCQALETVDISFNQLTDLEPLKGISTIGTLQASGNQLESLDLDFDNLSRLFDLLVSNNKITGDLPAGMGQLTNLQNFTADDNQITALPFEITSLKKIKVLKLENNPLKDQKVKRMIKDDVRKDLWKYLDKIGGGGKKGKGKKKGKKGGDSDDEGASAKRSKKSKKKAAAKAVEQEEQEEDEDGFDSEDSFDITMEEL